RGDGISQSITANEQCCVGLEWLPEDVDEVRIVRLVALGSDVAVDLVAAWMLHRIALGELPGVLAFADGRVIARQLVDPPGTQLVQPCIADVPDDDLAIPGDRN